MPAPTRQRGSSIQRVQLPSGSVRFRVRIDLEPERDEAGVVVRRRQRTLSYKTEREAIEGQARARVQVADAAYIEPSRATVRSSVEMWIAARSASWKPSTAAQNRSALSALLELIGDRPVQRLEAEDVDRAVAALLATGGRDGTGRSTYTVRAALIGLRASLELARRRGKVSRNVAADVELPGAVERERDVWTADELGRFLDAAEADPWAAGWHLLAHGLRRGEVIGATLGDVDLARRVLRVRRAAVMVGGEVVVGTPKTRRSTRDVPLTPEAVAAIEAVVAALPAKTSAKSRAAWPVVADEGGGIVNPDRFARRFHELSAEAGLPRIRVHDVRHSVATLAMARNGRVDAVARVLGHDPAVLLRAYAHPSAESARAVVDDVFAAVRERL